MSNFYIIGNPTKQSKSPLLFKYIFKRLNLNSYYKHQTIKNLNELSQFIKEFKKRDIKGINITMPLKEAAYKYVDELEQNAKIIKSINCIYFNKNKIIGYNNDYYGFSKLLETNNVPVSNSKNIIIGSGGSARSVILSLIHKNAKNICILSRNKQQVKEILLDMQPHQCNTNFKKFSNKIDFQNYNIINCTPIGMLKTNIDILDSLPKTQYNYIIDINYIANYNHFKYNAHYKINGIDMFIYQALKSLDIWFESNISNKLDYQELRKIIC
ncbi:MAG: hypothetical protein CMG66_02110 [Candidatus Marinimicrobia bacterium]|nr:hypothetical protein [Candidatus Neomarinimicrobiota bacterium]|tara:strand:- start:70799 stop:71608 length:810 start_codon:yes stop_codon:yes gene_type:complete